MATFKFYRYRDKWFYKKRPGFEVGKPVDTTALDTVLGVTGTRDVIVILPGPSKDAEYRVRINNGFIQHAHLAVKEESGEDLQDITEFVVREMK